jgi:membrane associated rhomboid family serine protease
MIPISDENPTLRTPVMTIAILVVTLAVWIFVQGAGFDAEAMATSVCNLGMVPGELTGEAPLGFAVPMGGDGVRAWTCVIDNQRINLATPLISMFLHGSWAHLLGNSLFLWVFGNNVEDSMGRLRFLVFYLICGLAAAGTHLLFEPSSPVPTVGASGAISGALGAYLLLYPRVRVKLLIPIIIFPWIVHVRAWAVLGFWFVWQVLSGLPQLMQLRGEISGGVAFWAHVGGFVAGMVLIRFFQNPALVQRRTMVSDARGAFVHESP